MVVIKLVPQNVFVSQTIWFGVINDMAKQTDRQATINIKDLFINGVYKYFSFRKLTAPME